MKYKDMTPEQQKEYSQKQIARQRKARQLAKEQTTILTITINNCTEALKDAIISAIQGEK